MEELLKYQLFTFKDISVTVGGIILAVIIWFAARVGIYVINRILLKRYFERRKIDFGRSYAIRTIVKYIIYFLAIVFIMKSFGLQLSVILLGSAGLLVGIGLGLQNTFNDLLSGFILLIEGEVEVGDVVVIDGIVGVVQRIGLRTSNVKTRDMVSIIIPNSRLVGNNVTNWSHNDSPARFQINFGVAYNSDIDFVEKLALDTINKSPDVLDRPMAPVHLANYGDSSVDFIIHFFSDEFFHIEKVKSDLRKALFKAFRENNVEIPFPQRDIWFKNGGESSHKG